METYHINDLTIIPEKDGAREYIKVSYPVFYGRCGEIRTPDTLFRFNLNGEIKYVQGRTSRWPHPLEWLKRTVSDDWIYYSAGDYGGYYDLLGEHYVPCLPYASNSLFPGNPGEVPALKSAIRSWEMLREKLQTLPPASSPQDLRPFLARIIENDRNALKKKAKRLHDIIGGPVSVLPPDSRHADYDVIPVVIADGCRYRCTFCRVKSGSGFSVRDREDVLNQLKNLKSLYGRDLSNCSSLFLGYHDSLRAGLETILFAAERACEIFEFERSYMKAPRLFLFGSADAMVHAEEVLFQRLNDLPFHTYINIGLESADPFTLDALGKPISTEVVREAFTRMTEVNRKYERIEITANFVFGTDLTPGHLLSVMELLEAGGKRRHGKGSVYLSPLIDDRNLDGETRRDLVRQFREVKFRSSLPVFLYLIQRL